MAAESDRVADALTLAQILAPLLAQRLGAAAPAQRAAESPAGRRPRREADVDRGIADFIEEMLVQDRAASA
jgi:hypothetical protein